MLPLAILTPKNEAGGSEHVRYGALPQATTASLAMTNRLGSHDKLRLPQKPELQPITVALRNLAGSQIKEWNMVMSGTLIAAVPTLLIYVILGRFFIRGLLAGSVKG